MINTVLVGKKFTVSSKLRGKREMSSDFVRIWNFVLRFAKFKDSLESMTQLYEMITYIGDRFFWIF